MKYLLLLSLAACLQTNMVRGPDGSLWMTIHNGPDPARIAAMGERCPYGYTLNANNDNLFECSLPSNNGASTTCASSYDLDKYNPKDKSVLYHAVRGPDCHMWLMCNTGSWYHCSEIIGTACPNGYNQKTLYGEDLFQCTTKTSTSDPGY